MQVNTTDLIVQEILTMKTSKKMLQEALAFEQQAQKLYIKHYPTYLDALQSFAHSKGFYDWDNMIKELQND